MAALFKTCSEQLTVDVGYNLSVLCKIQSKLLVL